MIPYFILFGINTITIPVYFFKPRIYLILNIIPLWVLMAFRSISVGADTQTYSQIFYQSETTAIPMKLINWIIPYQDARFENGFLFLNKVVYNIYPNFQALLIITSLITVICFVYFLVNLNINYVIGLLLYESMMMPFSMSAMRQGLAISFCMVAFVFLVKEKIGFFLLFNYLAITMQVTACMFLLVLVYRKLKSGWKSEVLLFIGTVLASVFFEELYNGISSVSNEAQVLLISASSNGITGVLNIGFSVCLATIVITWVKYYASLNSMDNNQLINLSELLLLTAIATYITALNFSQIARIAMYFTIGYFPCVSALCGGLYFKKNRIIASVLIGLFLIVYFVFVQTYRPDWFGIIPYNF